MGGAHVFFVSHIWYRRVAPAQMTKQSSLLMFRIQFQFPEEALRFSILSSRGFLWSVCADGGPLNLGWPVLSILHLGYVYDKISYNDTASGKRKMFEAIQVLESKSGYVNITHMRHIDGVEIRVFSLLVLDSSEFMMYIQG